MTAEDQSRLVEDLARMLNDSDERVRLAAVRAVGTFSFQDLINKLGSSGPVDTPGSVLANLAERVKDRKQVVRSEGMKILARIWAASIGEIMEGNDKVVVLVGGIPSKILNAYYANDLEINVLLDDVLFTTLIPLSYPPLKTKAKKPGASSEGARDGQLEHEEDGILDLDKIRVQRILLLAQRLDEKAKKMFFSISLRQVTLSKYVFAYLGSCEDYNVSAFLIQ